jgi:hypothetical protein
MKTVGSFWFRFLFTEQTGAIKGSLTLKIFRKKRKNSWNLAQFSSVQFCKNSNNHTALRKSQLMMNIISQTPQMKKNHIMQQQQQQFLVKIQSNCEFVCGLVVDMVLVLYCVWLLLLFFWYSLLCVDVVAANG